MDSDPFSQPSAFKVGKAQAYCPGCGAEEFARSRRVRHEKADALICTRCGAEHLRSALMEQITKQVMERADLALRHADELRLSLGFEAKAPAPDVERMLAQLKEAEELLQFPAVEGHVGRASNLLVSIARRTSSPQVRQAAMTAMSLAGLSRLRASSAEELVELNRILRELRSALEASRDRSGG